MLSIFKSFFSKNLICKYGGLYKIKGESLPFRYIYRSGDKEKKIYRFKHHNLKEYIFYDLNHVERIANKKEIRLYNLIKNHINSVATKF